MAAVVGGVVASRQVEADRLSYARREARKAALEANQRASDALAVFQTDLRLKVGNAAANPRLGFALQGHVDERTLRDLWRTEDWWRPWRSEFQVYAVSTEGTRLDVVEGIERSVFETEGILKRVRERGESVSEIVLGKGWPYAAAATPIEIPGQPRTCVLLLAKPLDQAILAKLAEKSGGALSLSDGKASILDAGNETERIRLRGVVGKERNELFFEATTPEGAREGIWAASASPLVSGQWLWAYASGDSAAHEATAAASAKKGMLWGAVTLVVAFSAFLMFAGRRSSSSVTRSGSTAFPPDQVTSSPLPHAGGGTLQGPAPFQPPSQGLAPRSTTARDAVGATELAPANRAANADAAFGRYTLVDRLGEGGMAEVYTAVTFGAEGFRRRFVVKRLRAELLREPAAVDQFIDEANLASSMVHSNIVPVFDFGKVGDEFYMAQEYILGRDLVRVTRRHIERYGKPLDVAPILFALLETLKALEYAHGKTSESGEPMGIVHRDVSPSNIIVSARGEVKLFDFGIVKAEGRVTRTETGVVKGNVSFMSPEQARGISVDARADLFSLGLVLYYCLSGDVLYTGTTTYELLVRAATGPGPEEWARIRAMPQPCDALLERALQPNVAGRFQSAGEFLEAVRPFVASGATDLATSMRGLFAEDFRAEEARFLSLVPSSVGTPSASGAGSISGSGSREAPPPEGDPRPRPTRG